jgi:predicted TIM-barrel fold metal-dependent hydrolase
VFAALPEFVGPSRVLFGSDFPYISPAVVGLETQAADNSKIWDDEATAAINRGNALSLFPRFRPGVGSSG